MQYYLVAFKEKLSKLDVEVEVFFDLENRSWVLDKSKAFNFGSEGAAQNFADILATTTSDNEIRMYVHKCSSNTR
ncbi:hypothetical protein CAL7716_085940 [Calothrix sp. PCC 7716]|nr:hypothetical protein CAL7716_085940 [Calothrix sp. PCC 7716]